MHKSNDIALVDKRVEQLRDWLCKESGCTVHAEWNADFRCYRFYFGESEDKRWQYILDVYTGDMRERDVSELSSLLAAAKWRQVLKTYSRKRVPFFKDKGFGPAAGFREWPKAAGS
jgi:hypothetical protein